MKKNADKITRASKYLLQNNSETNEQEILGERFMSLEKKKENYWGSN